MATVELPEHQKVNSFFAFNSGVRLRTQINHFHFMKRYILAKGNVYNFFRL